MLRSPFARKPEAHFNPDLPETRVKPHFNSIFLFGIGNVLSSKRFASGEFEKSNPQYLDV